MKQNKFFQLNFIFYFNDRWQLFAKAVLFYFSLHFQINNKQSKIERRLDACLLSKWFATFFKIGPNDVVGAVSSPTISFTFTVHFINLHIVPVQTIQKILWFCFWFCWKIKCHIKFHFKTASTSIPLTGYNRIYTLKSDRESWAASLFVASPWNNEHRKSQ